MRVRFVVIGHPPKNLLPAIVDVEKRLPSFCSFDVVEVKNEKDSFSKVRGLSVFLDTKGKPFSSVGFAKWLESQEDVTFLIGGPDGFSDDLKKKVDLLLSLSEMTFPHIVARLILAEQVYRAFTILKGKKYHR